jgi:hypothetical protein
MTSVVTSDERCEAITDRAVAVDDRARNRSPLRRRSAVRE